MATRGGVRRYLDTVKPEEHVPIVGEVEVVFEARRLFGTIIERDQARAFVTGGGFSWRDWLQLPALVDDPPFHLAAPLTPPHPAQITPATMPDAATAARQVFRIV